MVCAKLVISMVMKKNLQATGTMYRAEDLA